MHRYSSYAIESRFFDVARREDFPIFLHAGHCPSYIRHGLIFKHQLQAATGMRFHAQFHCFLCFSFFQEAFPGFSKLIQRVCETMCHEDRCGCVIWVISIYSFYVDSRFVEKHFFRQFAQCTGFRPEPMSIIQISVRLDCTDDVVILYWYFCVLHLQLQWCKNAFDFLRILTHEVFR